MRGRPHSARAALIAAACLALLVALLAPATAGADLLTPEAGPTENAVKTDTLYKIVFYIGITVIALVWAALFYSLFRYRAGSGRRSRRVPLQISGNLGLELGWTIAASAIVVAITVITYIFLPDIRNPAASGPESVAEARGQHADVNQPPPPDEKALEIQVSGQQYLWRYQYPNRTFSFHEMVVPRDQTVLLKIQANDVVHSWWIPKLGGKVDAVPGYTTETWFKATKNGVFDGQCAELCGANHAFMTAKVRVVDPEDYEQWVERQPRLIEQAQRLAQEQRQEIEAQTAP
ncbi:MAG: cytochrome c oxidase subunit II [Solirubrobacterales bacterium]